MRKIEKLKDEDILKVTGSGIKKENNLWKVYSDITGELIGYYKSCEYAQWADNQYKIDGTISYFGYVG